MFYFYTYRTVIKYSVHVYRLKIDIFPIDIFMREFSKLFTTNLSQGVVTNLLIVQSYLSAQCIYPCFPGVSLKQYSEQYSFQATGAFPQYHYRTNGQR